MYNIELEQITGMPINYSALCDFGDLREGDIDFVEHEQSLDREAKDDSDWLPPEPTPPQCPSVMLDPGF